MAVLAVGALLGWLVSTGSLRIESPAHAGTDKQQYTTINNPRPSFGLIVHHTDGVREYAYDTHPKSSGKLVEALKEAPTRGWTVVDMKNDWKKIFAFEPEAASRP